VGKSKKAIAGGEFDKKFDESEDISDFIDDSKAIWRVNVDFPEWIVKALDEEAGKIGINRQALIKVWVTDRLRHERKENQPILKSKRAG
jgi:hypothetical protein